MLRANKGIGDSRYRRNIPTVAEALSPYDEIHKLFHLFLPVLQEDLNHALLITNHLLTPVNHTDLERLGIAPLFFALCTFPRRAVLCAFAAVNLSFSN
jgi:hypothetical protein